MTDAEQTPDVTPEMIAAGRAWLSGAKIGELPDDLLERPFLDAWVIAIYRAMEAARSADWQEERIATLFDAIAHGTDAHRAWLKKAIDDHFAMRPVEPVNA